MQKLFDQIRQDVEAFVEQRDDLLLITSCTDEDVALVAQTISEVEQANGSDVFLVFADAFIMPGPYVSVLVERVKEQHRIACEALAEEGKEPLPPVPETLSDEMRPPFDRLKEVIVYTRSLLPKEGDHRLIWVMTPLEIADRTAYMAMISSFIPWHGIEPWMRRLRIICRDLPDTRTIAPTLGQAPRTQVKDIDLGQEAIEESLKDAVEDENIPLENRMHALLQLALLDFAHKRYGQAMQKYEMLLGHYQHTENHAMEAFVLNAIGDMDHRENDLVKAQYWYECAVPPVLKADNPVVFLTITMNLGEVTYKLGQYAEAEEYFDGADKLAKHLKDAYSKARALEWQGLSQEKQAKYGEAIASWEDAATLCRAIGMNDRLQACLEHLIRVHEQGRMQDKARAYRGELASVAQEEAK